MAQYGGYNQSGYGQGNRYNQQAGNPYAQSGNPYAQQQAPSNPYSQQQSNPYGQQPSNPYSQQGPQSGAYGGGANDIEMGQMNGQKPTGNDELALLNETRDITRAVETLEQKNIPTIRSLQQQYMDSTDRSDQNPQRQQLDALDAETMAALRNFTDRINKIKGRPGAGTEQNRAHIKMVQDRVGSVLRSYQELQNKHRKACEEQIARGLRYDNPNITQEAIQEAIDNGVTQPFMYSVQQSSRTGQSRSVLNAVNDRHQTLQHIERQTAEIGQMFQDLNRIIYAQEEQVSNINKQAEETKDHIAGGVGETVKAVDSARAARRKKWICFWICVAVIVILAVVLAAYFATRAKSGN